MRRSKLVLVAVLALLCLLGVYWLASQKPASPHPPKSADLVKNAPAPTPPSRIFYVNSYHPGYPWSDGIFSAFCKTLDLSKQQDDIWIGPGLLLKVFYMDSKRKADEAGKWQAAAKAEALVKSWQPDIVVTSDDNAVKYLVGALLEKTALQVVFTGVNWDASEYRLPRDRVTGMIEVQPVDQILAALQPYADGSKVCFLKGSDFSTLKEAEAFERFLGISLERYFVSTFEEWRSAYRQTQQRCDMLLLGNSVSIQDWDEAAARKIINAETRIPSGAWSDWVRPKALLTFSTLDSEPGNWAAQATREILGGKSPAQIEIVRNRKANIYRNMALAKQLDIIFPMEFLRRSWAVEKELLE